MTKDTESSYVPYRIEVEEAERWMERPIKVSLVVRTPNGSNASVFYLDEAERAELIRALGGNL